MLNAQLDRMYAISGEWGIFIGHMNHINGNPGTPSMVTDCEIKHVLWIAAIYQYGYKRNRRHYTD